MCSPNVTRTHEATKTRSSARQILSSVSSVILVEQVLSTVRIANHSPWQNAEIYRSHSHRNIQRFLLSLRELFCRRIVEANWKILKSPRHFIAEVLCTWISKADKWAYYRKIITIQHVYQFRLNKLTSSYDASHQRKKLSKWADLENFAYVNERVSETMYKDEGGDQ